MGICHAKSPNLQETSPVPGDQDVVGLRSGRPEKLYVQQTEGDRSAVSVIPDQRDTEDIGTDGGYSLCCCFRGWCQIFVDQVTASLIECRAVEEPCSQMEEVFGRKVIL